MTNVYFEELKAALEDACAEIRLKRPARGDDTVFALAAPVVTIGWPEVEITAPVLRDRVPGVAIGLAAPITDDGEERLLPVRLACIVWSPGTHLEPGGPERLDPSQGTGLQDLANLMDPILRALRRGDPLTPHLTLAKPELQWWLDGDSYGDYWLGDVTFTLRAAPLPGRGETDLL